MSFYATLINRLRDLRRRSEALGETEIHNLYFEAIQAITQLENQVEQQRKIIDAVRNGSWDIPANAENILSEVQHLAYVELETQRQRYKRSLVAILIAERGKRHDGPINFQQVAYDAGALADELLKEDEEHAKNSNV